MISVKKPPKVGSRIFESVENIMRGAYIGRGTNGTLLLFNISNKYNKLKPSSLRYLK